MNTDQLAEGSPVAPDAEIGGSPAIMNAMISDGISPASPAKDRPGFLAQYGRLWARVPIELGVLFVAFPLAVIATSVLWPVFSAGIGTLVLIVGFFMVLAALYVARGYGTLTLAMLDAAGRPAIPRPVWRGRVGTGFIGRVFGPLADGHYWLYLFNALIVQLVVSTVTWSIMIVWVATSLGGVSYGIWGRFIPTGDRTIWTSHVIWEWLTGTTATFDPLTGDTVLYGVTGLLFLITLPYVTRALTTAHWAVARGLLGSWRSEALRQEVDELTESRAAAVSAEDRDLRRLERDIHDGPQQRLVRLRMDIAAAQRRVKDDPNAATALLDEAGTTAQDALDELRALSRGFAPPILQDRGLVAALDSLASRAPVTVHLVNTLPADVVIPSQVERNVYFIAAELVTNVAKHAEADFARLELARDGGTLVLTVSDNGRGAPDAARHGLTGVRERVTALRGSINIASGASGTSVQVNVPLS